MEIIFLGTGSMIPTATRNHSAILFSYKDEKMLFDCGEGTQKQLRKAKISPAKINKIFISHWHGDHVLGLPGLVQTLGASEYSKTLEIYGPKGSKKYFKSMFEGFINRAVIKIKIKEINEDVVTETKDYEIRAARLNHSCPTMGYSFVEKERRKININYLKKFGLKKHPILRSLQEGKDIEWKGKKIKNEKATTRIRGRKITIVMDTAYTREAERIAKDSDILICEATHMHDMKDKTEIYKHLTSKQAAEIAKKAKAKKLILTHFSQRYKDINELCKEAKTVFKNTICAEDFMKIDCDCRKRI